jgi:hypothetical protein
MRLDLNDDVLSKRIDILDKKSERSDALMAVHSQATKAHTDQYLNDFRDEIEKRIPSIDPVTQHIDQKMSEIQIDLAGFRRELQLVKNDVHYGEKKFENIYTLLDRIRGK